MTSILVRAHKHPFRVASVDETRALNLIGDNTGNLVFSQSVFRLLSTRGTTLEAAKLRRDDPAEISERHDHLVIPLANAFRFTFLEALDAMSEIIEKVTIPVSVVGVGAQATLQGSYQRADDISAQVKRFVTAVLERSPSIGVRGEFTAEYLRELGFGDEHVDVIGCPSLYVYGPDLRVQKKVEALQGTSKIAFNVSPYVHRTGPISLRHAERYPNLVYMAQDMPSLDLLETGTYTSPRGEKAAAAGVPVTLDHPLVRQDRTRFFVDPRTWFDHLAGYEFSFGTRIHGNIAALLAGTPALVVAHDSRTLELADFHEIPRRPISELPDDVDAADLYAEADWGPMERGHGARWDNFRAFLERHGLHHVYEQGQDARTFDATIDGLDLPGPVHTLMGRDPHELYAMKRRLDRLEGSPRAALRLGLRQGSRRVRERLRRG